MTTDRTLPSDPLEFIQRCVRERKVYWTYHVNMRLTGRHISRDDVFGAGDSYEVIESYPDDKYLRNWLPRQLTAAAGNSAGETMGVCARSKVLKRSVVSRPRC